MIWFTLVRIHTVDSVVAGHKNSDDCTDRETDNEADPGISGSTDGWKAERWVRTWLVLRGTYPGSYASTHCAADEGVAQTVFVFHEFHAANVLLRNGLSARGFLERDPCFGEAHEASEVFLRVHFNNLNPLSRI
ncbi:MAG: hypothetical protein WB799_15670 [Candidatus Sulfotelmatobacter sp.]